MLGKSQTILMMKMTVLNNTNHDWISKFCDPVDSVLVTMDVRSLYMSITNSEGICCDQ